MTISYLYISVHYSVQHVKRISVVNDLGRRALEP